MIELNKFYIGESVTFMKDNIPDNLVDLTITSPPYDDLRQYNGFTFDYQSMLKELYRVTKDGGVVVWVVGDKTEKGSETGTSFRQALYARDECGFNLHDTMIYEKDGVGARGSNYCYWQVFEYMFVLSKGKPNIINRITDVPNKWAGTQTYSNVVKRRNKQGELVKSNNGFTVKEYGIRTNIWRIPTGKGKTTKDKIAHNHPAIFPDKLAEDHILSWSKEGDVVFDPMCGAGTTCKMAYLNKRNFIGIDMSDEYINDICIPRLKQYEWNDSETDTTIYGT